MPGWGGAHRGGGLIGGGGAAHGEIFNSDLLYKLGVEFLGQVDGILVIPELLSTQ